MKRKRIAIFGGSFDPIHTGHLHIAKAAVEQLQLDLLIFVPAGRSPHKPRAVYAASVHRIAMIKLCAKNDHRWTVDEVEVKRRGVSYSIDTVDHFSERYPGALLYLLIGSDNVRSFATWKRPKEIARRTRIIVYQRWEHEVGREQLGRWNARLLKGPAILISSSQIRLRRSAGRTIKHFVPTPVERYILRHTLYAGSRGRT